MIVSHFERNTTFLKPSINNHALSFQEHYTDLFRSFRSCKNLYNVLGKTMSWLFIDGFRNVEICVQNAKQSHTYLQHSTLELRVWMTTIFLVSGGSQGHEIIKLLLWVIWSYKFNNKCFCLKVEGENVLSVKCLECGEDVTLATCRQHQAQCNIRTQ